MVILRKPTAILISFINKLEGYQDIPYFEKTPCVCDVCDCVVHRTNPIAITNTNIDICSRCKAMIGRTLTSMMTSKHQLVLTKDDLNNHQMALKCSRSCAIVTLSDKRISGCVVPVHGIYEGVCNICHGGRGTSTYGCGVVICQWCQKHVDDRVTTLTIMYASTAWATYRQYDVYDQMMATLCMLCQK